MIPSLPLNFKHALPRVSARIRGAKQIESNTINFITFAKRFDRSKTRFTLNRATIVVKVSSAVIKTKLRARHSELSHSQFDT